MGSRAIPSKCCETCRIKRRRCDFKKPACSQCQRAASPCPGYQDSFTLRLRDHTNSTARRVQLKKRQGTPESASSYQEGPSQGKRTLPSNDSRAQSPGGEWTITTFKHDRSDDQEQGRIDYLHGNPKVPVALTSSATPTRGALSFFMHTYVTNSSFHYLPKFYNALLDQDEGTLPSSGGAEKIDMDQAIAVPALILLSRELNQPLLAETARQLHVSVLAATQQAISDPKRALLDSTLVSVLLLGLVEALNFRGRCDPCGLDAHTLGAAELVQMRGTNQLDSNFGRYLFFHACAIISRRCALHEVRVPLKLRQLNKRASTLTKTTFSDNRGETRFVRAAVLENFASLKADITNGSMSPSARLQRALALSGDLDKLVIAFQQGQQGAAYQTMSIAFYDTTFGTKPPTKLLCANGGLFHVYSSPWIAKRWNDLRMMRLYVAQLIRDALLASAVTVDNCDESLTSPPFSAEEAARCRARAMYIAEDASTGILQSVFYMLHLSNASRFTSSSLMLPLASVAVSDMPSDITASLARDALRYMRDELGISQAAESLQMSNDSKHLEKWVIASHCI